MFKDGKIPDIMGYQSPIEQYVSDITMKMENDICTAVQNVGIRVDKEELIKALSYDRGQWELGYDEGYEQGRKEALESIKEKLVELINKNC